MFTFQKEPRYAMDSSDTKRANDLFRSNEQHLTSFLKDDPIAVSNLAAGFAHLGYQVISVQGGRADLKLHLRPV